MSMSTSSNESEDDEVAKKIRSAVCNESIPVIHLTDADIKLKAFSLHKNSQVEGLAKDQCNRNKDVNDKDFGNILNTTPGFRVHVSKQLCIMLDKKLKESLSENVWKCTQQCKTKYGGIHLFSNSKHWCYIGDGEKRESLNPHKVDSHKPRKHKISSSSESSVDEKISSCVFSPADITKENDLLTKLQTLPAAIPSDQVPKRNTLKLTSDHTECSQKHKKAKKKRNKVKTVENKNTIFA